MGHSVICIDNFDDYYSPKMKGKNVQEHLKNKNFFLFRKNVCNFEDIEKIFKNNKIDQVIHLAARTGPRESIYKPLLFEKVNVEGTLNILRLCRKFNIRKLIFASSSSVYGENKKLPFSESDATDNIISPYAATKRSAEILCEKYSRLYGIDIICLRFFTVYGQGGRPDMAVYKFTDLISKEEDVPLFGDGKSKRDYIFIDDIIKGILTVVNKGFKFEVFNLGSSRPVDLYYLISLIEKNIGKKAKIKQLPKQKGDVPNTYADMSKSEKLLGFKPKIKIEEGIKIFVDWYKKISDFR